MEQFDAEMLALLARKACGREDLRLEGYQAQVIKGGAEVGSSIQRISGVGEADGQATPWSLILKTITCGPGNSSSPQAAHYWAREPYYYQSGILDNLPAGLRAPRCYGAVERPGSFQLFLEDLCDEFHRVGLSQGWPLDYYRRAARCLGRFNGAYLGGRPVPEAECIPHNWLRAYVEEAAPDIELFLSSADHPILKRCLGQVSPGLVLRAWDQHQEILDALDRQPQVFCHQDAFYNNLFAELTDGGDGLVAIDWSFAGPGALGTELSPLVGAGLNFGSGHFSDGDWLVEQALEGYLAGLGEAGWHGNPDLVRFAYCASSFWRYLIGAFIGESMVWLINEAAYPFLEQWWGVTIEQLADRGGDWMTWSLPYYEEALRLKKKLHL